MAKKYKFDLTVDATALLQANPVEFYARLFGMESASSNYRVLPGVKNKTKIANVLFAQVTQAAGCAFAPTNSTVSALEVDVCQLSIQTSVCQYELESAWLADQMAKGSNSDMTVASFMTYFWEQFSNKAHEELATLRWQGDTGSGDALLDECDGWLKRLCGLSPVRTTYAAVDSSNVLAKFAAALEALPEEAQTNIAKMQFKVSSDVAIAYMVATASTNTVSNVTTALGLTYLGIPIVIEYGMPTSTILLSDPMNFVMALDLEGDMDSLQIVDFSKTTLDREIGARADYKAGFYITNSEQIVAHMACVAS